MVTPSIRLFCQQSNGPMARWVLARSRGRDLRVRSRVHRSAAEPVGKSGSDSGAAAAAAAAAIVCSFVLGNKSPINTQERL